MTVNLVQLSEQGNGRQTSSMLRTMEEIENLEAEVIVLYTSMETIQLMLQKVHLIALLCFLSFVSLVPKYICHTFLADVFLFGVRFLVHIQGTY